MSSALPGWPIEWGEPRSFQVSAVAEYNARDRKNFLLVAAPGAGKTKVAAYIAKRFIDSKEVSRVVIVVHTNYLKKQWHDVAHQIGLELDSNASNSSSDSLRRGFKGEIVTYPQIAIDPKEHKLRSSKPTLVIFDEIHHAGEHQSWGRGLAEAFGHTPYRLSLSGTPWRTRDPIVTEFVEYDEKNTSIADFDFTYQQAISPSVRVCREVVFPDFKGNVTYEVGEQQHTVSFDDDLDLSDDKIAKRIRTAVDANSGWAFNMLKAANTDLRQIRENYDPDAAGIVVTFGHTNAVKLASMLSDIDGGIMPAIVTHKIENSINIIEDFKNNKCKSPWIVAVRMISEGVDIPRLRVCAYLTNVTRSRLAFYQIVGRVLRPYRDDPLMTSRVYLPKDPRLTAYAREFESARAEAFQERADEDKKVIDKVMSNSYKPISGESEAGNVTLSGQVVDRDEYLRAQPLAEKYGWTSPVDIARYALVLRDNETVVDGGQGEPTNVNEPPLTEVIKDLRSRNNYMVTRINDEYGIEFRQINYILNKAVGVTKIDELDPKGLAKRLSIATWWYEKGTPNGYTA